MTNTSKWHHIQTDDEYCDFSKELFSVPDEGNTSVDMRLTFNTTSKTCSYSFGLRNDSGKPKEWEDYNPIPWSVGIAMLLRDEVAIPEELVADKANYLIEQLKEALTNALLHNKPMTPGDQGGRWRLVLEAEEYLKESK